VSGFLNKSDTSFIFYLICIFLRSKFWSFSGEKRTDEEGQRYDEDRDRDDKEIFMML
jgi:hypothetical protein